MMNRISARFLVIGLMCAGLATLAGAERDLTINSVLLNGFTGREISVRPGEMIRGTVVVSTSSSSFFRTHTGVWLPSWDRTPGAMKVFIDSIGSTSNSEAAIEIAAPNSVGVHYLLFCFDRKSASEMFTEITSRSDDQIFANGRAIKIIVDPSATPPPQPSTRESAWPLEVTGVQQTGKAGHGVGQESYWRIATGSIDWRKNQAIRITVTGLSPAIDLDLEITDAAGRRIGYSEAEGSQKELSVVRALPNGTIYARVFAYKTNTEAGFRIKAEKIVLSSAIQDPSSGNAVEAGNNFTARSRAGTGTAAAWFRLPVMRSDRIEVEARGTEPAKDLDLWIYDDLGNLLGVSRNDGSTLERAVVERADSGVYYIKVGAFRASDASDFDLVVRAPGALEIAGTPSNVTPTTGGTTPTTAVTPTGLDTGAPLPAPFTVMKGQSFERWLRVGNEASFILEVFTGWGDVGKIDSIRIFAPDGALLWERRAEGRGWEAEKIVTRGAGMYRILIEHAGPETRSGRIEASGLTDRKLYAQSVTGTLDDSGTPGPGLDAAEREMLRRLYDMFLRRGPGAISAEESDLLKKLEDYFLKY